ncbi:hypothetical protein K7432_010965 [Basidiobolus ranarum]|uniref:Secreted protein n=1 Tax=Basidiobolus ranarum TaxID=34480 RepID=A0ABR2WN02_9FUNG
MHFTSSTLILISAVAATLAQSEFNIPSAGACIDNCNQKGADGFLDNFTSDPKSPNFIASLGLMCDKKGANYGRYMAAAGMCMAACTSEEATAFNAYHTQACEWYTANKDVATPNASSTVASEVSSATSASASAPSSVATSATSANASASPVPSSSKPTATGTTGVSSSPAASKTPSSSASGLGYSTLMVLGGAALSLISFY